MMRRLRASRDECLLFMGIRISFLPPRKPMDPTDLASCPSNLKTAGHCNQDPHANPTCVSSTKIRVELRLLGKKLTHQLTEIVSQLGIADALFSAGETRAKESVCSRRLGHSLGRHI